MSNEYMLVPYHLRETLSDILRQPDVYCIDLAEIIESAPLHTTPQASVIDEAMVKRACNAYDNQLDNILYLESLAIYPAMHAALKAALEQP